MTWKPRPAAKPTESRLVFVVLAGSNRPLPESALLDLARDPDPDVRIALVRSPRNLPSRVVRTLLEDDNWHVVMALIGSGRELPPAVIHRLAGDDELDVRAALAGSGRPLSAAVQRRLLTHEEPDNLAPVVVALLLHAQPLPRPTVDLIARWLARPDSDRWSVAASGCLLPPRLARILAADPDLEVRREVLDPHPEHLLPAMSMPIPEQPLPRRVLPPDVLDTLARDPAPDIRWLLAEHPGLPRRVIASLASDSDEDVREGLVRQHVNPITAPLIRRLARDPSDSVRCAVAASDHPLPADAVRLLAHDRRPEVRHALLRRNDDVIGTDLVVDVLTAAPHDSADARQVQTWIKAKLTGAPRTWPALFRAPTTTLRRRLIIACTTRDTAVIDDALNDPDPLIRAAAAANPAVTVTRLRALTTSDDPDLAAAATTALIRRLATP